MAHKLNLGSGDDKIPGFISVDLYDSQADVQADICELPFEDGTVSEIVAYQVVEHIEYWKEEAVFREMHRVLEKDGKAIVECPDIEYIAQAIVDNPDIEDKWVHSIYGQYYRPWDKERYPDAENHEGSKHRNCFSFAKMKRICEPIGFTVRRREMNEKHPNYRFPETLSVELRKI